MKTKKITSKKIKFIKIKSKIMVNNQNFSGYKALYHSESRFRTINFLLVISRFAINDKKKAYQPWYRKCGEYLRYMERGGKNTFNIVRYISN